MKKLILAIVLTFGGIVSAKAQVQDTRYVIIHKAGKAWNPSLNMFQQPYIMNNPNPGQADQTHVKYYAKFLSAGKLALGGPFPNSTGALGAEVGMMVPAAGISEQEMTSYAAGDPAVKAGVLDFEVREWMIGMKAP